MPDQSQPASKPVKHYRVQPRAYNAVVQILGQLPFNQVAGVIQELQNGSTAVFEEPDGPPPTGKIARQVPTKKRPTAARKKANGAKTLPTTKPEA